MRSRKDIHVIILFEGLERLDDIWFLFHLEFKKLYIQNRFFKIIKLPFSEIWGFFWVTERFEDICHVIILFGGLEKLNDTEF